MIERERLVMPWMIVLSLSDELYSSTRLGGQEHFEEEYGNNFNLIM
jgi:hypothetical protein